MFNIMKKSEFILQFNVFISKGEKLNAVKLVVDNVCEELKQQSPNRIGLKESKELVDDFSSNPEYIWKKIKNKHK